MSVMRDRPAETVREYCHVGKKVRLRLNSSNLLRMKINQSRDIAGTAPTEERLRDFLKIQTSGRSMLSGLCLLEFLFFLQFSHCRCSHCGHTDSFVYLCVHCHCLSVSAVYTPSHPHNDRFISRLACCVLHRRSISENHGFARAKLIDTRPPKPTPQSRLRIKENLRL